MGDVEYIYRCIVCKHEILADGPPQLYSCSECYGIYQLDSISYKGTPFNTSARGFPIRGTELMELVDNDGFLGVAGENLQAGREIEMREDGKIYMVRDEDD